MITGNVAASPSALLSGCQGWASLTSATIPDTAFTTGFQDVTGAVYSYIGNSIRPIRVNVSSTTTVYLSGFCNFPTGSAVLYGTIEARRMH
jgi:hypothetical protein